MLRYSMPPIIITPFNRNPTSSPHKVGCNGEGGAEQGEQHKELEAVDHALHLWQ